MTREDADKLRDMGFWVDPAMSWAHYKGGSGVIYYAGGNFLDADRVMHEPLPHQFVVVVSNGGAAWCGNVLGIFDDYMAAALAIKLSLQ